MAQRQRRHSCFGLDSLVVIKLDIAVNHLVGFGECSGFVAGTVVVGFPYLVRTVLGLSAEHHGAVENAMGIAAVLDSLFVGVMGQKFGCCCPAAC